MQESFGPVEDNYYVHSIKPLYDEKVHHIIVNGCTNKIKETVEAKSSISVICHNKVILFAWALGPARNLESLGNMRFRMEKKHYTGLENVLY